MESSLPYSAVFPSDVSCAAELIPNICYCSDFSWKTSLCCYLLLYVVHLHSSRKELAFATEKGKTTHGLKLQAQK